MVNEVTLNENDDDIIYSIRNLFIDEDEDELSVVCYSRLPDIFYPCNHENCFECYQKLNNKCHFCRTVIKLTDRGVNGSYHLVFINENGDVIGRNNYSISETFY
jgi:hypothetical protein